MQLVPEDPVVVRPGVAGEVADPGGPTFPVLCSTAGGLTRAEIAAVPDAAREIALAHAEPFLADPSAVAGERPAVDTEGVRRPFGGLVETHLPLRGPDLGELR